MFVPSCFDALAIKAGSRSLPRSNTALDGCSTGSFVLSANNAARDLYGDTPINAGTSEAPNTHLPCSSFQRASNQSLLPCFCFGITCIALSSVCCLITSLRRGVTQLLRCSPVCFRVTHFPHATLQFAEQINSVTNELANRRRRQP
jgi:hypothetical protein